MPDGLKSTFTPIRAPGAGPLKPDLCTQYSECSAAMRANPLDFQNMLPTSKLLRQILAPYAELHGELVVNMNGSNSYFEIEGKPFTNFATVLLTVIRIHFTDHIRHDFELLIWGQHLPPKIIRVETKRFRSNTWLDELGPQYICEHGIRNIQILLQAMSQYAPAKDEYQYSGWVIGGSSIYIMSGQQINGDGRDTTAATTSCLHALEMLDIAAHSLTIPLLAVAILSLAQTRMMALEHFFEIAIIRTKW